MDRLSKRQIKRIHHFFREKELNSKRKEAKFLHRAPSGDAREKESTIRLLAGNVDQLVIVASFVSPPLKMGLIDRMLVMAGVEEVTPIVVLNKTDLLSNPEEGLHVLALYRSLGYETVLTSKVSGEGIEHLREIVKGKSSLLAGHSGAGKSSLLNCMEPGLPDAPDTREVSASTNKGRHTTTTLKIFRMANGGVIFDLPGIKLAPLNRIEPLEVQEHFPELRSHGRRCRFSNCLHAGEPGCAVKDALSQGLISEERFASYLRMIKT